MDKERGLSAASKQRILDALWKLYFTICPFQARHFGDTQSK
ncbi:hypothetical protein SSUST3_0726 [Streptococcus suis ST3]|nr:hypothetical protein SSUST3_0726 [Streptococcus suis ST3]AER43837.1 hypothetical protein SSUA7_0509 [Streptococcus suis A7]QBX21569.1 hypothetical protein Javan579_0033 [Streptococcus phage Javan579]